MWCSGNKGPSTSLTNFELKLRAFVRADLCPNLIVSEEPGYTWVFHIIRSAFETTAPPLNNFQIKLRATFVSKYHR